jgi:hypothetical protein
MKQHDNGTEERHIRGDRRKDIKMVRLLSVNGGLQNYQGGYGMESGEENENTAD